MPCLNLFIRETEDLLSGHAAAIYKELQQLHFRDRIKQQIEERQRAEALEKEQKMKAAEERRHAVLERIRRKKEEEEERLRLIELQKKLVEEEKTRLIRVRASAD